MGICRSSGLPGPSTVEDGPSIHGASSDLVDAGPIQELLIDQLRDILHAEKQLLKALPKMAKAARSSQLQRLMDTHLAETEVQVERLNESLKIWARRHGQSLAREWRGSSKKARK